MKPTELKTHVLGAVKRAADKWSGAKFGQVRRSMPGTLSYDDRDMDRALQMLRREGSIEYLGKRDPKTGEPRAKWGWRPVTTPVSKKGARRGQ